MIRVTKKFMKAFFVIGDNILDKKLKALLHGQSFVYNRAAVGEKVNELVAAYA